MPQAKKSTAAKSETLTIRLNPRTRFLLEFVSRLRGQTITTVVERALIEAADAAKIFTDDGGQLTWEDYWDLSDGIRELNMAAEPILYPTFDEEKHLKFAQYHWPFFYTSKKAANPRRAYVDILWPDIDKYIEIWETQRAKDWHSAGRAMQKAIADAGVVPPEWPHKDFEPAAQKPTPEASNDSNGLNEEAAP